MSNASLHCYDYGYDSRRYLVGDEGEIIGREAARLLAEHDVTEVDDICEALISACVAVGFAPTARFAMSMIALALGFLGERLPPSMRRHPGSVNSHHEGEQLRVLADAWKETP